MNDIVITFDVDWAPDFVIRRVANILIEKEIKATWFITHDSPVIRELFEYPDLFEIGIHPNFMPETTQGKNYHDVMEHLMKIVPHAKSVRTHGLFQSSNIMKMMAVDFDLENDVSIYLREVPRILPFEAYYDDKILLRIPYFWTEDGEMYKPNPSFLLHDKRLDLLGLKIFAFHPVHVYLNSRDMNNYNSLKRRCDIRNCTETEVKPHINNGIGANSLLHELIQHILRLNNSKTISDIAAQWEESKVNAKGV
jgi:hypothetical protein